VERKEEKISVGEKRGPKPVLKDQSNERKGVHITERGDKHRKKGCVEAQPRLCWVIALLIDDVWQISVARENRRGLKA